MRQQLLIPEPGRIDCSRGNRINCDDRHQGTIVLDGRFKRGRFKGAESVEPIRACPLRIDDQRNSELQSLFKFLQSLLGLRRGFPVDPDRTGESHVQGQERISFFGANLTPISEAWMMMSR